MPIRNSKKVTKFPGLYIYSKGKLADALINFDAVNTAPTTATGYYYLYVNSSGSLVYDNGSSATTIGSPGGVATTWESIYVQDKSMTIDSTTLTYSLTHATGDGLTITGSAGSAGQLLQFSNAGSGLDIQGTGDTWSISSAGAAILVGITGCDTLVAAANLALDATSAGTITLGATSTGAITLTRATSCTAGLTVGTGITVTAGGILSSDGIVDIVDNANNASTLRVTNNTQNTYGNASDAGMVVIRSESLTTGALLHLSADETNMAGGDFLRCWSQDAGADAFSIKEFGLTTIAGVASGTDALILTAGDILVTAGHIDMTLGDFTMADGSVTVTDADNAASLTVTNDTATSASVVVLAGSGVFTGSTTTSWMTISPSGMATGTGVYAVFAGLTEGIGVHIATDATQTTGSALLVQNTGVSSAMTSGTVATFDHTSSAVGGAVNKIGSVVSVTSNRTVNTGGNTADDFDLLSIVKTTTRTAGTAATAGSALYVQVVTTGTVTETSNGIEVVMDSGGTGAGISLTHAATGGVALNVISASTTVSDVVITGSGIKETTKANLEITNGTAANKAGSSLLRVASGASTPAAATSYLTEFTYAASTMTNNPITMQVNSGSSTGAAINVTGSGVGYSLSTFNTNAGGTGVQWYTQHTSATAADNDVVFTLDMAGVSSTPTVRIFGSLKVTAIDITDGTEDGKLDLQVMVAGTLTSQLYIQSSTTGATTLVSAAAASTFAGSAAGTAAITVTNGDVSLSAGGFDSTTIADIYGLDVTVNVTAATQGAAVITNAHTTSGKAVLELEQADLDKPYMKFSGATAITSATAGSNGDVPAQVVGYLNYDVDGTERRVAYYAA